MHERLVAIDVVEDAAQRGVVEVGGKGHVAGRQDAAHLRDQMRHERQRDVPSACGRQPLGDLGRVPVARDAVCLGPAFQLGEQEIRAGTAPRAGHARLGVDHHLAVKDARPGEGHQCQQCGGRVAAGVRDELCSPELIARELGQAVDGIGQCVRRRMLEAIPGRIRGRVGQPQVRTDVDHCRPTGGQAHSQLSRLPVRQRQEGNVHPRLRRAVDQPQPQRSEVRKLVGEWLIPAAARVERVDRHVRMAGQQPDELGARVAAGTHDCGGDARRHRSVSRSTSSACCTYRRFSAWSSTTERGPSSASSLISSPRCAGRQCITRASGAWASSASSTRKPAKRSRRTSASASAPMLVQVSV